LAAENVLASSVTRLSRGLASSVVRNALVI